MPCIMYSGHYHGISGINDSFVTTIVSYHSMALYIYSIYNTIVKYITNPKKDIQCEKPTFL